MSRIQKAGLFIFNNAEAFVWIAALIALATASPVQTHFTICPFNLAGFHYCPGCGLGHSITLLFHGRILDSISMHPLGIPATAFLLTRITTVTRNSCMLYKCNKPVFSTENHQTA